MAPIDAAFVLTALMVWVIAAYKLVRIPRGAASAAPYALVACLVTLATALTLQPASVQLAIDRLLGPKATLIIGEVLVVAGTCSYQVLMLAINDPRASAWRRARPRVVLAATASVAMVILFILSPATDSAVRPWTEDPATAGHVAIYAAYLAGGAIDVARLAHRFVRLGDRDLLRLGLYMVTGGSYAAAAYAVAKIAFLIILPVFGLGLLSVQYAITKPLIIVAALLCSVGSTLPSWGRWVGADRPARWLGCYLSLMALYPLWRALSVVVPEAVLDPRPRWADRLPIDVHFRLTRRVIEIRDGLVALRPCRHPQATDLAAALAADRRLESIDPEALVEAAEIAMALETRKSAATPVDSTPPALTSTDAVSLPSEVSWLARVTDAFTSPMVRTACMRWVRELAT
jgi:hypothetical protein